MPKTRKNKQLRKTKFRRRKTLRKTTKRKKTAKKGGSWSWRNVFNLNRFREKQILEIERNMPRAKPIKPAMAVRLDRGNRVPTHNAISVPPQQAQPTVINP